MSIAVIANTNDIALATKSCFIASLFSIPHYPSPAPCPPHQIHFHFSLFTLLAITPHERQWRGNQTLIMQAIASHINPKARLQSPSRPDRSLHFATTTITTTTTFMISHHHRPIIIVIIINHHHSSSPRHTYGSCGHCANHTTCHHQFHCTDTSITTFACPPPPQPRTSEATQ